MALPPITPRAMSSRCGAVWPKMGSPPARQLRLVTAPLTSARTTTISNTGMAGLMPLSVFTTAAAQAKQREEPRAQATPLPQKAAAGRRQQAAHPLAVPSPLAGMLMLFPLPPAAAAPNSGASSSSRVPAASRVAAGGILSEIRCSACALYE